MHELLLLGVSEPETDLIEVTDDPPTEIDVGNQASVEAGEAFLGLLEEHIPSHAAQDPGLGVGRVPGRIGLKGEAVALSRSLRGRRRRNHRRKRCPGDRNVRRRGDDVKIEEQRR